MARSRAAVAAAVLVAHALLVLGWQALTASPLATPAPATTAQPPLVVRLLSRTAPEATRSAPPAAQEQPPAAPERRATSPDRRTTPSASALQVPQAAALPASPSALPATADAPGSQAEPARSAVGTAPADPASAPLRRDLPRTALPSRLPALDDARARTPTATLGSRIARATAATWTEEALGDGRIRYRRGDECVVSTPSRDGGLDPFNQAVAPKARGSGPC